MWFQKVVGVSLLIMLSVALPVAALWQQPNQVAEHGVVVEEVAKESAGASAGLQAGDVILSWSRGSDRGNIESPFDWTDLEIEQIPRGPVTIRGIRDSRDQTWTLSNSLSGITIRPVLRRDLEGLWQRCRELEKADNFADAAKGWRAMANQLRATDPVWLAPWLQYELAQSLVRSRQFEEADSAFQKAIEESRVAAPTAPGHLLRKWGVTFTDRSNWVRAEDCYRKSLQEARKLASLSLTEAASIDLLGVLAFNRGDLDQAGKYYQQALAIRQRLAPGSLAAAETLNNLGTAAFERGDLDRAAGFYQQALAIRRKWAAGSLAVAQSVNNMGNIAWARGDLDQAQECYQQALAMRQQRAPGSLDVAVTLNNLGSVAADRGDAARAEQWYQQALAIRQKLAPGGLRVADTLSNLGTVTFERGDLARTEEYFVEALGIQQKLAPGSLRVAVSLNNLGDVALHRGDLAWAEEYDQRALAIRQKLAPGSLDVAFSFNNLSDLALLRGDLARAEEYDQQALAIRQKLAPGSPDEARSLNHLGDVAERRGHLRRAEEYLQQALGIQEKVIPGSLPVSETLNNLGHVALDRANLALAEAYYQQALAIRQKLAPGSLNEATTLHSLGVVLQRKRDVDGGTTHFARSVDALEKQTTRLGGTEETRSSFRAKYAAWYLDLEGALLARKQSPQAYRVSERYRARSFLQMLAERDLIFAEVPADIQRARRQNGAEYDRVQAQIAELNPAKDQKKIDGLLARLRELSGEREQIAEQIKKTSPRFASLQYPQPLDVAGTREVLDPGTTLLSYSVGDEHTILFVVQSAGSEAGFSVFTLPVKEKELQAKVQEFRRLIEQHRKGADNEQVSASRQLYDLLLKPAESLVAESDRLLIVPDGPLQVLPFAALLRDEKQYLAEWKPLHAVVSATAYGELRRMRPLVENKAVDLVAFGDPGMPVGKDGVDRSANAELRFASERGFTFGRLPFSRQEVEGIAALYPKRSRTYLGAEATEEHAKAVGKDVRYIHFAAHGLLDERFPLNSAIVLTIPQKVAYGQENGLLQAWEIFEQVRLDADLVTLSACNTGLGQDLSGEGLIGLTRAFQYAGARSVLASLWNVDDFRTMQLMEHFYQQLKAGTSKDEALRQAQLALIHSPASSSPFYWAAFSLIGDWK